MTTPRREDGSGAGRGAAPSGSQRRGAPWLPVLERTESRSLTLGEVAGRLGVSKAGALAQLEELLAAEVLFAELGYVDEPFGHRVSGARDRTEPRHLLGVGPASIPDLRLASNSQGAPLDANRDTTSPSNRPRTV
jgi:hypothetical protein